MEKQIQLGNQKVAYCLRISQRARRMRLAIYCDGSFVVTVPHRFDLSLIDKYIYEKAEWVLEKMGIMQKSRHNPAFAKFSKKEYRKLKGEAVLIAKHKVDEFNKIYGLVYNKITIRNQKTRWGSCSKKGNLNYNYKIALMPEDLADYIIVHEICHLQEFNHSKNFWNLVAKTVPDYKERRKKIRSL